MPRGGLQKPAGGRPPGAKNKATLEKEAAAKLALQEAAEIEARMKAAGAQPSEITRALTIPGKKLGKDILRELMELHMGRAAFYQPWPLARGRNPHEDIKEYYANLALAGDYAKALAPFESPRFSAVMIGATAVTKIEVEGGLPDGEDLKMIEGTYTNGTPLPGRTDGGGPSDAGHGRELGQGSPADVSSSTVPSLQIGSEDEEDSPPLRKALG